MTDKTADGIAEIRARTAAATKGPWGSHRDLNGVYTVQARPRVSASGMDSDGDIATLSTERTDAEGYANACFMARAREDVPFLLDRVAELEALVKDLTDPDPCHFDHHGYCQAHGYLGGEPMSCPHGRAHTLFPETKETTTS